MQELNQINETKLYHKRTKEFTTNHEESRVI